MMFKLKAGATPIEKANVNNLEEIIAEIKKQFSAGKKGTELAHTIQEIFSYKEGEEKPIADWDNPDEIEKQRDLVGKTFRRMGLPEEEIKQELAKIGF